MKLFAALFGCALSGGQILSVPRSEGLLNHDGVSYLQILTGKANLKTETEKECGDICKSLTGRYMMECNTWIHDAWTLECHLFKNTNPDFEENFDSEDDIDSNKLIRKLEAKGHDSFPTYRFQFGSIGSKPYAMRNVRFGRITRHDQYKAAKYIIGELPKWEMEIYSTLVPALHISPGRVPVTTGETVQSVAIWWVNEPECSQICDLTVGCKAWTYVKDMSGDVFSPKNFEGCFLHEKTAMATTKKCYSGYRCAFGFAYNRTF